ncbi:hypothetical protein ACVWZ6_003508 [Bradyrhizobium sp. GM6.1]
MASAARWWLRARAVRVGRPGLRVGTTALRTMGLGAVTVTAGISVDDLSSASAEVAAPSRSRLAPPRRCARRNLNDMVLIPVRRRPHVRLLIGGGLPSLRDGIRLQLLPGMRLKAASPGVIKRCGSQDAGGARGWNAVPADFRWTNSASVVR